MTYDILIVTIIFTFFLTPILTPRGRWFWFSSGAIAAFISFQWVQSYLYKENIENKYGPGHMLGDVLGTIIAGAFVLGLSIRFFIWLMKKVRDDNVT